MSFDFLNSQSTSSSTFRVVCGDMVLDDRWYVHGEVALALVKSGSLTIVSATNYYSMRQGDLYIVSPNQKYKVVAKNEGRKPSPRVIHLCCMI